MSVNSERAATCTTIPFFRYGLNSRLPPPSIGFQVYGCSGRQAIRASPPRAKIQPDGSSRTSARSLEKKPLICGKRVSGGMS